MHPSLLQGGFGNEGRQGVVVLLPAGRYVVTQTIELTQSNVVVRGEGVRSGSWGPGLLLAGLPMGLFAAGLWQGAVLCGRMGRCLSSGSWSRLGC